MTTKKTSKKSKVKSKVKPKAKRKVMKAPPPARTYHTVEGEPTMTLAEREKAAALAQVDSDWQGYVEWIWPLNYEQLVAVYRHEVGLTHKASVEDPKLLRIPLVVAIVGAARIRHETVEPIGDLGDVFEYYKAAFDAEALRLMGEQRLQQTFYAGLPNSNSLPVPDIHVAVGPEVVDAQLAAEVATSEPLKPPPAEVQACVAPMLFIHDLLTQYENGELEPHHCSVASSGVLFEAARKINEAASILARTFCSKKPVEEKPQDADTAQV